jgi:hypothetical protein
MASHQRHAQIGKPHPLDGFSDQPRDPPRATTHKQTSEQGPVVALSHSPFWKYPDAPKGVIFSAQRAKRDKQLRTQLCSPERLIHARFTMPRNFFRFPAREQVNLPPTPPPKSEGRKVSAPTPLGDNNRARRATLATLSPSGPQSPGPTRLPHRVSASDSYAQGFAWRATPMSKVCAEVEPPKPADPAPPPRPLRRSKGHQPIADERERRGKSETLLQEQSKLKREINEETIKLSRMQKMQQAIRDEREKVEKARKEKENLSRQGVGTNAYCAKSRSTPVLPDQSPYNRGRTDARSSESFQSASSSQEHGFRRVWSRTPSVSSNDRSPPPALHWQRIEQARRERERERALLKLAEARALEKKAFEEAWGVYESRWMLLNFATRSSPIIIQSAPGNLTLSFRDIPWPLLHPPSSCDGITTVAIRMFLASEHQSSDKSLRDRIREALLRWHPDRFEGRIMEHVRIDQREEVKKGADIVVRCLNELLSKA